MFLQNYVRQYITVSQFNYHLANVLQVFDNYW